jgi:Zn-dependent protease
MERPFLPPVPAYDPPAPPSPPEDEPPRPAGRAERQERRGILGTLLVVGALLAKFGKVAFVAVKGAKFATTSLSMLVSVGAYALIWGIPFAVGFVALLFIHELGHALQLRREGIRTSPIVFLPFLGAVVGMKDLPKDAAMEARVGLAGPVLGSLAAAATAVPYLLGGGEFWLALSFTGLFLNLFNLVPVSPLDGGRAMSALSPWMWFVGLGVIFALVFVAPNPILILIALVGAFDVYRRWKERNAPGGREYFRVPGRQRALVGAVYLLVLVGCIVGMDLTHVERTFSDV